MDLLTNLWSWLAALVVLLPLGIAAVTTQKSTQETYRANGSRGYGVDMFGSLVALQFDHVQSGAGDATSTVDLAFIPPGRFWLYEDLSRIEWTAFVAARVLDIGYKAYTDNDGNAVNASANAFDDDIDVSVAGSAALGSDAAAKSAKRKLFSSRSGVVIYATVAGGTIPDAAELHGHLTISK